MTHRFELDAAGAAPSAAELRERLNELEHDLDTLVGPVAHTTGPSRPERGLAELVETYRPRQKELIDLLHEEGEITSGEHALLAAQFPPAGTARATPPRPAEPSPLPHLAAERAAPVPAERGLPAARPVPELLRLYQITTLRQAGAVRARRQISFAEYMALKRHFEAAEPSGEERPSSSGPP